MALGVGPVSLTREELHPTTGRDKRRDSAPPLAGKGLRGRALTLFVITVYKSMWHNVFDRVMGS